MGPFPHHAPPATISKDNPMGTDGFAFVEFASPEPDRLHALFRLMGFAPVARHRFRAITVYRQGNIDFLVNEDPSSHAARFAAAHGPSAPSMGFRVVDAHHAYTRALALGAEDADPADGPDAVDAPAITGIGGSRLVFIDRGSSPFDQGTDWLRIGDSHPRGVGLFYIDHLTHNVGRGRMDVWAGFYERLFNFREIRSFDIKGEYTGLYSRALTSPDGRIRIPINESADGRSQIEEYLTAYRGEGIQHVACGCRDIHASVEHLRKRGLPFMPVPPATYYEAIDARVPGHGEDLVRLARNGLLIDGTGATDGCAARKLLQVFSATVIGPIFFEFIQRKGDDGFGEGNFRALFRSIEEDQVRRGVLRAA
ncbi:MAG: 4-hydroxyphenylpyruvate dioxygenase [Acetobacteraceae bacterium]